MAIGRILLSGLGALAVCVLAMTAAQAQTMASLGPNEQALAGPSFLEQGTPRPTDPVRRAAFDVLDTHCSRCHQSDRLINRSKPAKGFGNILDLDALAANPKYVKPGDADRSLIVHVVVRREMPSDVFQDGDLDHPTPDENDLKALRAWIGGMTKEQPTETPVASARPTLNTKVAPLQFASLPHAEEHVAIGPSAKPNTDVTLPSQAPPLTAVEMVVEAQKNLRRLGCFKGEADGVRDSKTDTALDLYNARLGRNQHLASLTPELLEEMGDQSGKICRMTCPVGEKYEQGACVGSDTAAVKGRDETLSNAAPAHRSHPAPRPQRPAIVEQSSRDRTANRAPKPHPQPERQLAVPHRLARAAPPPAPSVRQAQRAPRSFGGGGGGGSAQDTISGVNGI